MEIQYSEGGFGYSFLKGPDLEFANFKYCAEITKRNFSHRRGALGKLSSEEGGTQKNEGITHTQTPKTFPLFSEISVY